uniref:hypothetical protein n=1 Tax=Segatella copri TaxID=165179 RepID=UPI0025D50475|nr:hypothetical protein [Prevotella sp.]
MKKSYFFSAFAAGMVMFSACSSDNDLANGGNGSNDAVQQIVLQVANAGDGMQTRAGRPLLSSEAKQTIENVKVIICDESNTIVKVKTYDDWNNADSKEYGKGGGAHGRETTLTYTGTEKLGDGTYTIYAYGFHKGTAYKKLDTQIANLAEGQTLGQNIILECSAVGEEIFAGSTAQFTIDNAHQGFTQTVVLNRQVAGTFGYFESIPFVAGATKLQLVASNPNKSLVLGNFNSFDLTGNGTGNGTNVKYVVNGTNPAADKVVYTIDLTKWFKVIKDGDNDGLIDADADNWNVPTTITGASFKTGSVFGGSFLIPFQKNGNQTFVLQLVNNDGDVLKSWAVKLPSTDGQLSEYTLSSWNSSVFNDTPATKDAADKYSVVRNHLYGIGERTLDEPTTPGTDPDKPEPLNKKQELTLRVNDNWEVIHKMELE